MTAQKRGGKKTFVIDSFSPEEIKDFEETNKRWKEATRQLWEEMDLAVNSGNFEEINKAGIRLNSGLLAFRLQNPHLFV